MTMRSNTLLTCAEGAVIRYLHQQVLPRQVRRRTQACALVIGIALTAMLTDAGCYSMQSSTKLLTTMPQDMPAM